MIDLVAFIGLLIFTPRIICNLRAESGVYDEFGRQKVLPIFLLLLPVSPILLMIASFTNHRIVGVIIAPLCFLPALIAARQDINAFEISGTSRTDKAKDAAHMAFSAALVGLLYVGIHVIFQLMIGTL